MQETAYELYQSVRAHVLLGRYDAAREALNHIASSSAAQSFVYPLLDLQLAVAAGLDPVVSASRFFQLENSLPEHDYFRGEFYITGSLIFSLCDQYRKALDLAEKAATHYRKTEFVSCLSAALYNMATGYNHLNFRESAKLVLKELDALAQRSQNQTIQLMYLRATANDLVNDEQFSSAVDTYKKAIELCVQIGRMKDFGSISLNAVYAAARGYPSFSEAKELIAAAQSRIDDMSPFDQKVLLALKELLDLPFLDFTKFTALSKSWKDLSIDGVHMLFLLGISLIQLDRSEDFEGLIAASQLCQTVSRESEQSISLIDARFFEARGLYHLGRYGEAEGKANAYLTDSLQRTSKAKEQSARELLRQIHLAQNRNTASLTPILITYLEQDRALKVDDKTVELKSQPILLAFFHTLVEHGEMPLADFFTSLYKVPFDPDRHARRLHSLIERARAILGDRTLIVRSGGAIKFSPQVVLRIVRAHSNPEAVGERRLKILKFILRSTKIKLEDLEREFPQLSRRTLQLDLKYLLSAKLILADGSTHTRIYKGGIHP